MRRFVALCLIGLFLAMPFVVAEGSILPYSSSATVAASGTCVIRVQYMDGYPRSGAEIKKTSPPPITDLGITNESGLVTSCGVLSPGSYIVKAYYPPGTQFGPNTDLDVDGNGDGSSTIIKNWEITPPVISVFSPQNQTYEGRSIPLNFSVFDYSPVSWMGYSLDGQANNTVTGNVTLNVNAGAHSMTVYANDTYGNMGSSDTVCFSSLGGRVVIRVQYQDGFPRSGADIRRSWPLPYQPLGTTNESGTMISQGVLIGPQDYQIQAWYGGSQFGPNWPLHVDENGDGSTTIRANYEITPPSIAVLSPQNQTYDGRLVPLNFTVYDYSPISWMGLLFGRASECYRNWQHYTECE